MIGASPIPDLGALVLRDATIMLHDELASLEIDMANAESTKAAVCIPRWQEQHDKLALFFDLDVYLGRVPAFAGPVDIIHESPPCVGFSKFSVRA